MVDARGESSFGERIRELEERGRTAFTQVLVLHRADCDGLWIEGRVVRHCVFESFRFSDSRVSGIERRNGLTSPVDQGECSSKGERFLH